MTYHKENLKENILDKTCELINQKGYQNVSLRMVSRELKISATAVYRHYHDHEDLMRHVTDHGEQLFSDYLIKDYQEEHSSLKQLLQIATNYVAFSLDFPHLYDLMFLSKFTPVTSQKNMLCDLKSQGMTYLVDTLEHLIEDNQLDVSLEDLLTQLWSFIQGYTYLVRFQHFKVNKIIIERTITGLLEGWK